MNCTQCQTAVPPAFVAAIRQNQCPACGGAVLSDDEHQSLLRLSATLLGAGLESDDMALRVAAALFDKFDVFPKGVVVDNVVQKEVIYLREEPQAYWGPPQQYGYPPPPQYQQPTQNHKRPAPPLATRRPPDERMAAMQAAAREAAESENDDIISDQTYDEPTEEYAVQAARQRAAEHRDPRDEEAERLARSRLAKLKAQKAGVV